MDRRTAVVSGFGAMVVAIFLITFIANNGSLPVGPEDTSNNVAAVNISEVGAGTPTANDDITRNVVIGEIFIDESGPTGYLNLDNTDGAAVWQEIGVAGVGGIPIEGQNDTIQVVPTISAVNAGIGILGVDSGLGVLTLNSITPTPIPAVPTATPIPAVPTATPQPTPTVVPGDGVGYDTIEDEDVGLAAENILNFTGAGVICAAGVGQTDCTIPGGGGGGLAPIGDFDTGNADLQIIGATAFGNDATEGLAADVIHYTFHYLLHDTQISDVFFEVTTAALTGGALGRVCVFEATEAWQPALLVRDYGTIAIDSTGKKTLTATNILTVSQGRYIFALIGDDTFTVRTVRARPLSGISFNTNITTNPFIVKHRVTDATQIDTACSADGTDWDTSSGSANAVEYFIWQEVLDSSP